MKNLKKVLVKNSQGDVFKIELGDINIDSILSVYLIPFDSDLSEEFLTVDILNESVESAILDFEYTIINM